MRSVICEHDLAIRDEDFDAYDFVLNQHGSSQSFFTFLSSMELRS